MIPFAFDLSSLKHSWNPRTRTINVYIPAAWENAWLDTESGLFCPPKVLAVTGKAATKTFTLVNAQVGDASVWGALYVSGQIDQIKLYMPVAT